MWEIEPPRPESPDSREEIVEDRYKVIAGK